MFGVSKDTVERLRKEYPVGCRVELTHMNDPYRPDLVPGCRGTVTGVDDSGSIHVNWDVRSSLAVVYGEDSCRRLDSVSVKCYGTITHYDERSEALREFREGLEACEGAEKDRYVRIFFQLMDGKAFCTDEEEEDED